MIDSDTKDEYFDLKAITSDKKEALRYHCQRVSYEDGGREFFYEEDEGEYMYMYMVCDSNGQWHDSFCSNSYPPKGYTTDISGYKGTADVSLRKGDNYLYVLIENSTE